jgi:hypothetical protein
LIEATSQGTVGDVSEVEHIGHDLVKVRCIGSDAVVSVLISKELIGFMTELSLDNILEAKFVERISLTDLNTGQSLIDLALFKRVSEPVEQDGLQLVPLL